MFGKSSSQERGVKMISFDNYAKMQVLMGGGGVFNCLERPSAYFALLASAPWS